MNTHKHRLQATKPEDLIKYAEYDKRTFTVILNSHKAAIANSMSRNRFYY